MSQAVSIDCADCVRDAHAGESDPMIQGMPAAHRNQPRDLYGLFERPGISSNGLNAADIALRESGAACVWRDSMYN
jgi:hypothetical protein